MRAELKCFIEYEGLRPCHLIFEDEKFYAVYIDEELADDVVTFEEFLDEYGSVYYETVEDFKNGNSDLFQDWETDQFGPF